MNGLYKVNLHQCFFLVLTHSKLLCFSPFLFPFECRQQLFYCTAMDRDRALSKLQVWWQTSCPWISWKQPLSLKGGGRLSHSYVSDFFCSRWWSNFFWKLSRRQCVAQIACVATLAQVMRQLKNRWKKKKCVKFNVLNFSRQNASLLRCLCQGGYTCDFHRALVMRHLQKIASPSQAKTRLCSCAFTCDDKCSVWLRTDSSRGSYNKMVTYIIVKNSDWELIQTQFHKDGRSRELITCERFSSRCWTYVSYKRF